MEIRPILSALMRSKVALVLIGLQIALTLAIVCNALFIINQRIDKMGRPSGMQESDLFYISSIGFGKDFDVKRTYLEDLATMRAMPGVLTATMINSVPMSDGGWSEGVQLKPDQTKSTASTAIYMVDEQGVDTLGVKLTAGRNFRADEIGFRDRTTQGWPASLIISQALADKLFPEGDALGKQYYMDKDRPPSTVIGIVEVLQAPWPNSKIVDFATLVPEYTPYDAMTRYLVRAEPGRRDEVLKAVEAKLGEINKSRIVRDPKTIESIRKDGYREDRAMALILGGVILSLLAITALGIVGMASFWVTQRTKQIGTRRALGATRTDILRYFLTENFLITTLGLLLGAVFAYGFNAWLMANYEAVRLPWHYVVAGFVALWVLGQLAVLGPATRASRVPPAVATRSV